MTASSDPAPGAASRPPAPSASAAPPRGRLEMRQLLKWLRDDGLLAPSEADLLARRFGQAGSSLHPLLRLPMLRPTRKAYAMQNGPRGGRLRCIAQDFGIVLSTTKLRGGGLCLPSC